MTSFSTQYLVGPVIGSMVGSDKGDFSNRAKCAGAQLVNNVKTVGAGVALGAGTYLVGRHVAKSPARIAKAEKYFDWLVSKLPKNFAEKLTKAPAKVKALAMLHRIKNDRANLEFRKEVFEKSKKDNGEYDPDSYEEFIKKTIGNEY